MHIFISEPWVVFAFQKDFNFHFKIFFWINSKAFRLKPWFEFEYSNQFRKVPNLKNLQKVYLNLYQFDPSSNSVWKSLNLWIFNSKALNKFVKNSLQPIFFTLSYRPTPFGPRIFSLKLAQVTVLLGPARPSWTPLHLLPHIWCHRWWTRFWPPPPHRVPAPPFEPRNQHAVVSSSFPLIKWPPRCLLFK
jgi:hypothetical protein